MWGRLYCMLDFFGCKIFWWLNSSNVQPDNESLLMINSCSSGVYFFLRFVFSCTKTGRLHPLAIYIPFEGLLYITGYCSAFMVSSTEHSLQTLKHGPMYDLWFQRPCLVAQVFDVWFALGTIRPQARIPSGLEKEFKGPVLVDLTQDHVNGEELKGPTSLTWMEKQAAHPFSTQPPKEIRPCEGTILDCWIKPFRFCFGDGSIFSE